MKMPPDSFLMTIGGVPFISNIFRPNTLITAVACSRNNSAPKNFPNLADYFSPENARSIYKRLARSKVEEPASTSLSAEELESVKISTENIQSALPQWNSLFSIPIKYRKLFDPMSSSTSALIPQTIYLGQRAFSSTILLEEVLVHEHAHTWLNFIMEIYDLQLETAPCDYVLPSGTSGKTLRGVLAAAHFSAAALIFYRHQRFAKGTEPRQEYLEHYLSGCLQAAFNRPCFTPMGHLVFETLNTFHTNFTSTTTGNQFIG